MIAVICQNVQWNWNINSDMQPLCCLIECNAPVSFCSSDTIERVVLDATLVKVRLFAACRKTHNRSCQFLFPACLPSKNFCIFFISGNGFLSWQSFLWSTSHTTWFMSFKNRAWSGRKVHFESLCCKVVLCWASIIGQPSGVSGAEHKRWSEPWPDQDPQFLFEGNYALLACLGTVFA